MRTSSQISLHEELLWSVRQKYNEIFLKDPENYSVDGELVFIFPVEFDMPPEKLEQIVIASDKSPWKPSIVHPMHEKEDLVISGLYEVSRYSIFEKEEGRREYVRVQAVPIHPNLQFQRLSWGETKAYEKYLRNLAATIVSDPDFSLMKGARIYAEVSASRWKKFSVN